MKIQCHRCQKLALNHPDSGQSTDRWEAVIFARLIKGMCKGCAGCTLVCNLLPLLNDYLTERDDSCKLAVYYNRHCFTVKTLIVDKDEVEQWIWIGDYKLYKTTGK